MELKLGLRCIYRPRVAYGRQSELFCFVIRIIKPEEGVVDLIAFPSNSEPVHYNNVARRSETVTIHCWEPAEPAMLDEVRMNELIMAATGPLIDEIAALRLAVEARDKRKPVQA